MELLVKKEIIDWCNQTVDDGKELKFTWEGGGDSGWADLVLDGNNIDVPGYSNVLLDGIYEHLDYGSWAGEFHASGEAIYDKDEQAFVGVDNYSEDETVAHSCSIVFDIPSKIWYDSINIRIESEDEGYPEIEVSFIVRNGFLTQEHREIADLLKDEISAKVNDELETFKNGEYELRSIWDDVRFNRSEGVEIPGFIKHEIGSISIGTTIGDEKEVYLKLIDENEE